MKMLPPIRPTAEQLPLISDNRLGMEIIRGAAGSGKTSTAILRLRSLAYMFEERREREGKVGPVKILVLTFNRTLGGYVRALIEDQVNSFSNTSVTVDTFGRWAMHNLGNPEVINDKKREAKISQLAALFVRPARSYLMKEVDYLLGRFLPEDLQSYVSTTRAGRGIEPRVEGVLRKKILEEIVIPYKTWLKNEGLCDWNDVAVAMVGAQDCLGYEIVIVDECQDFSANQLRAVRRHVADEHAVTFVIDAMQRVYARGFVWPEIGFDMRGARYHTLQENHRNTAEIAAFTAGILDGIDVEADGSLPNLTAARRQGEKPKILRGIYPQQAEVAVQFIKNSVNLKEESVAFLKPLGGVFFREIMRHLQLADIPFVDITRERDWPVGAANVALSTFHSAKGLEFDHVFILGLNNENTAHGDTADDDQLMTLRRLLAVAVARARKTVVIGYKPGEESRLMQFFKPGTYEIFDL